jgi:hypothetical protein
MRSRESSRHRPRGEAADRVNTRLRCGRRGVRRRGMTIVVVLGLIAMTLALSYAMMRSQVTSAQIQENLGRRVDARQAAMAGLWAALRRMNESTWTGVGTSFSAQLNAFDSFTATWETGDASLSPSSPEYAEYPFRVTIESTGFAADPANPASKATHKVRAVAQLARRRMASPVSNWSLLQYCTVTQWSGNSVAIEIPVRAEGPLCFMGPVQLCTDYPNSTNPRKKYLGDLERMRAAGRPDYRPFNGPIFMPTSGTSSESLALIQTELKVTTVNISQSTSAPFSHPGEVSTYRLFDGGKAYAVPRLTSPLSNVTIQPDPVANPLGIYYSSGTLDLHDDVTIRGTVIVGGGGKLRIRGKNVHLLSQDLPAIEGATQPRRLPVALVSDDLEISSLAGGSLQGFAMAWDDTTFEKGPASVSFAVTGRVATRNLRLRGRNEWDQPPVDWDTQYTLYSTATALPGPTLYFPDWMQTAALLDPQPLLTIRPDSSGVSYHWQTLSNSVYVPHSNDGALRWDLVDWADGT